MTVVPAGAASAARHRQVTDAMLRAPKLCGADVSVAHARAILRDDHVHAVLLVDGDGRLVAVVERADLVDVAADRPARLVGRLGGRVVAPHADVSEVRAAMRGRRRRLAVIDGAGRLLGLLCLKQSGLGFCSDDDVRARAADPTVEWRPAARVAGCSSPLEL